MHYSTHIDVLMYRYRFNSSYQCSNHEDAFYCMIMKIYLFICTFIVDDC